MAGTSRRGRGGLSSKALLIAGALLAASLLLSWWSAGPRPSPLLSPIEGAPDSGEPLRFVVLGDQGRGNPRQYAVAAAMKTACERLGGCAFAVTVGDNIYPSGVVSVDDPLWEKVFEAPYAPIPFPFWASLGNHDHGGDGGGWEFWRGLAQVAYSEKSEKWRMPARHYAFSEGPVDLFVLDTTELFWGRTRAQAEALKARLAASSRRWKIAVGHHPYLSNGHHGDAGSLDGLPGFLPASGTPIKRFFEEHLCDQVDLYLAGHDHNLQDLLSPCRAELVVSGAGSSTDEPTGRQNPAHFMWGKPGFAIIEATREHLDLRFFDASAEELHFRRMKE